MEVELNTSCCSSTASTFGITSSTPPTADNDTTNPWPFLDKYFSFTGAKGNSLEFKCVICAPKPKLLSVSKKSMYNLKLHVSRMHPSLSSEVNLCIAVGTKESKRARIEADTPKRRKRPTLQHAAAATATTCYRVVPQADVDEKVIAVFVDNILPLEVVDSVSFGDLIKTLQPDTNVMSRRTLTRRIEEKFEQANQDLKDLLANISSVATTIDAWSCGNRSYLGMTVHWINASTMKRQRSALACRRLLERHNYAIWAKTIEMVHREFGIENKVVNTTTDNAIKVMKAFRMSGEEDSGMGEAQEGEKDDLPDVTDVTTILEGQSEERGVDELYVLPKRMRCAGCAAHTMNLVATTDADQAMESSSSYEKTYKSAFTKAWQLWNQQCRSTQAADVIRTELGDILVVPSTARWSSEFDSVSSLVAIIDEKNSQLHRVCSSLKVPMFAPTDITFLKEYSLVLKPVAVTLDILRDEEKAYLGLLLPAITVCVRKLKAIKHRNLTICEPLVEAVVKGIQSRFATEMEDLDCLLAAAFHPQFKLSWLPADEDATFRWVRDEMVSLVDRKMVEDSSSDGEENPDNFFKTLHKSTKSVNGAERLVKNYLESPVSDTLPNPSVFPSKAFMEEFIKFNTPIPSSASVETLFALGKDIVNPTRAGLTDKQFEMRVFLKGKPE